MNRRVSRTLGLLGLTTMLTLTLAGCVSGFRPEPEGEDGTLVVGMYRFDEASTLNEALGSELRLSSIRVTAEPVSGGPAVSIMRRADGLLGAAGIPPGDYRLVNLAVDVSYQSQVVGGGELQFDDPRVITIAAGSVSNIGTLVVDFTDEDNVTSRWERNFRNVKMSFADSYPESLWNGYEWVAQE